MINLEEFRNKRKNLSSILVDRFDLFFDGFASKIIDVLDDYIELGNEYEKQTAELAQAEDLLRTLVDNVTKYNCISETYECVHCGAWMFTTENVEHESDCPVVKVETFLKDLK